MKGIIYVFMAIVMVASVSAINVDCGSSSWWNPMGNYCEDNELQWEFDQMESMIDDNSDDISDVESYVSSKEASWSQDSSGTSFSKVERYLFSDFIDFLKGIFVGQSAFEQLEDRMYEQEATIYFLEADREYNDEMVFLKAVLLEMEDKGLDSVEHGDSSCSMNNGQMICLNY